MLCEMRQSDKDSKIAKEVKLWTQRVEWLLVEEGNWGVNNQRG